MSVSRSARSEKARLESMRESIAPLAAYREPAAGPAAARSIVQGVARSHEYRVIPTDRIAAEPGQPRTEFDDGSLRRLGATLKKKQIQACVVYPDEARGLFILVAGERRWRAATAAGVPELICRVYAGRPPEDELRLEQLVENCAREALPPMDQARALAALAARGPEWTQGRIAEETGLDQPAVSESLGLLALPPAVRAHVEDGALPASTARALRKLPEAEQVAIADRAAGGKMTREEVRDEVKSRIGGGDYVPPISKKADEKPAATLGVMRVPSPRNTPPGAELFLEYAEGPCGPGLSCWLDERHEDSLVAQFDRLCRGLRERVMATTYFRPEARVKVTNDRGEFAGFEGVVLELGDGAARVLCRLGRGGDSFERWVDTGRLILIAPAPPAPKPKAKSSIPRPEPESPRKKRKGRP